MTDASAVHRTISAASGVSAASDGTATAVNESLEGLVSAVDELKRSMGMGNQVDFAAVEQFVQKLRQENEEFREFAEQAILSAQRLRDERDELQYKLDQVSLEATMGAALAETQKLKDVADEFERDLYEQKLAEAGARGAEVEALKERVAELEDENAGLTQTLNEFRATTQQLQRLQSHEVRRLQRVEASGAPTAGAAAGAGVAGKALQQQPAAVAEGEEAPQNGVVGSGGAAGGGASGSSSPIAGGAATPGRSPSASPRPRNASASPAPSAQSAAAVGIAEQLEEVAGGANSGLLAEAAAALRELSRRDAALQVAEKENARLQSEVDELNDTMFSKTFKPPSAWAEREVKYKSDKKYWEEQQKVLAARLAALTVEMEAYRGAGKAQQLEERIQELEARLLQTEREKDAARAQLHELQLSTRTEGEFGAGGKRLSPYKAPLGVSAGGGHEVQQMVEQLEHGGIGTESPEVVGMSVAAGRLHGLQAKLTQASDENQHLRRQLNDQQVVQVPASLQGQLGQVATVAAVLAAGAELDARLAATEAESHTLRQQLGAGAPLQLQQQQQQQGGEGGSGSAAAMAEQLEQRVQALQQSAQQAETAGDNGEVASLRQQAQQLTQLGQRLEAAEGEKAAVLADLAPLRLMVSAAAADAASGGDQQSEAAEVAVPASLQADLGATAPMAAVAAKAAELEARLAEAEAEAGIVREQVTLTLALEQQLVTAAAAQRQALSGLAEAQQQQQRQQHAGSGAAEASSAEVEQLQQQLQAAQRQKEGALQQLWQVAELQDKLQRAEADRRRLASQLQQAQPVSLQLAVAGVASGSQAAGEVQREGEEGVSSSELAALHAELLDAQQHSNQLRSQLQSLQPAASAAAPVTLALNVGSDGSAATERLAAAEAEAARLRQQLADLHPVRLQLSLAAGGGTGGGAGSLTPLSVTTHTTPAGSAAVSPQPRFLTSPPDAAVLDREASSASMVSLTRYSGEQAAALSQERAAADAALRQYQKANDVPSLLRANAELETRCQMLEAQLSKMQLQGELEHVDESKAVMEAHLDSAIRTGDVSGLSGLKETLGGGQRQALKRMFKRQGKGGASPSKDTLKNTVHEMQDALSSSEEEKNALKRQLAKLSKKYQQLTQQQAHTAGIVAGAAAMHEGVEAGGDSSPELSLAPATFSQDDDGELELLKMREENQMLMEHVVMVKVRQAEMEGEFLESRRQAARFREKNHQLARKLADLREAAERGDPLPFTPRDGAQQPMFAAKPAAASSDGDAVQPMRKGLMRIPGL